MKERISSHYKIILTAGFAMFAMFFGAGNLVFPLTLGAETIHDSTFASAGLMVTGIVVPFLGLLAIIFYDGNRETFFSSIGKKSGFFVTLTLLALLGPLGAVPRCITVAYGGFSLILPECPHIIFSALFCAINIMIIWNYDRIIPIIGAFLTPWLLICIAAVVIGGIAHSAQPSPVLEPLSNLEALTTGLLKGYHTMDLLAAFFFSATTVRYLRHHLQENEAHNMLMPLSIVTSILGAGLLAIVYFGFIHLGARFSGLLEGINPHQMLVAIAGKSLGPVATITTSLTIILACLTTVAILASLFADFFNTDVTRGKLGRHPAIIGTLIISFFMSMLGFEGLYTVLAFPLQIIYPALIAMVLGNILGKITGKRYGRYAFWIVFWLSLAIQTYSVINKMA